MREDKAGAGNGGDLGTMEVYQSLGGKEDDGVIR